MDLVGFIGGRARQRLLDCETQWRLLLGGPGMVAFARLAVAALEIIGLLVGLLLTLEALLPPRLARRNAAVEGAYVAQRFPGDDVRLDNDGGFAFEVGSPQVAKALLVNGFE